MVAPFYIPYLKKRGFVKYRKKVTHFFVPAGIKVPHFFAKQPGKEKVSKRRVIVLEKVSKWMYNILGKRTG